MNFADRHYSFVPARANWTGQPPPPPVGQSYNNNNSSGSLPNTNRSRGLSPIQASPVELPAQLAIGPSNAGSHKRTASSDYYEDVDPRFAEDPPSIPTTSAQMANVVSSPPSGLPSSTVIPAGYGSRNSPQAALDPNANLGPNSYNNSYEDLPEGARSPAASEASHFTSVSQRGINPQWNPPPPNPAYSGAGYGSVRRPDAILEQNPDFALPGQGRGGRGGARGGRGGMRGGMREPGMIGMGGMGRYPGGDAI